MFIKINNNLKNSAFFLFLALAVGIIYGSQHFFISRILKSDGLEYHPAISENFDETAYYYPRVASVYRGNWLVGDFSVSEYKGGPTTLGMLNPVIGGLFGRIAGSFESGLILADVVLPFFIFIAVYLLILEIVGSRMLASLFAVVFMFSPLFAMQIPPTSFNAVKELFYGFLPLSGGANYFSRLEYPQATYLFYVLALYFLLRAVKFKERKDMVFAGAGFGILFYTYFYDWTYFSASLAILFFLFIVQKKYQEAKIIAAISIIGLVASFLYWINLFELYQLPQFNDIVSRMGNEISHQFRFWTVWKSYLRIIILSALLLVFVRKKYNLTANYLIAFLAAYFVAVNVQVVTGFNPQPDHWYRELFLITALSIILIACALLRRYDFWIKFRKPLRVCLCIFLILFLTLQLRNQYVFSLINAKHFTYPAQNAESYDWFNKNTIENSVIGSLYGEVNNEILLFTRNKTFLPNGFVTLAPTEEIWMRTMILAKIFGIKSEDLEKLISENHYYLFTDKYRNSEFDAYFGKGNRIVPADILNEKLEQYKKLKLADAMKKYRLDYLYYAPGKSGYVDDPKNTLPDIRKVYDSDGVIIYKL